MFAKLKMNNVKFTLNKSPKNMIRLVPMLDKKDINNVVFEFNF